MHALIFNQNRKQINFLYYLLTVLPINTPDQTILALLVIQLTLLLVNIGKQLLLIDKVNDQFTQGALHLSIAGY